MKIPKSTYYINSLKMSASELLKTSFGYEICGKKGRLVSDVFKPPYKNVVEMVNAPGYVCDGDTIPPHSIYNHLILFNKDYKKIQRLVKKKEYRKAMDLQHKWWKEGNFRKEIMTESNPEFVRRTVIDYTA